MNVKREESNGAMIEYISFLDTGREFEIVSRGDFRGVALRPIVEDMGLDWGTQFRKIKNDEVLETCVVIMTTQVGSQKRDVLYMDIQMIPWFFGTIQQSRVRADLRETVIKYKRYAAKVLFEATFGRLEGDLKVAQAQLFAQRRQVEAQAEELAILRRQGSSLRVQGELFRDADILPARAKVRGLLAAYSGKGVSMAAVCRFLKEETGFDAHKIRNHIRDLGGKATLLNVIDAHGHSSHALDILCRLLR